MKKIVLLFSIAATLIFTSCAPKFLVANEYLGEGKIARSAYLLKKVEQTSDGKQGDQIYSYIVRICDLGDDGISMNCQDTLVLDDVVVSKIKIK